LHCDKIALLQASSKIQLLFLSSILSLSGLTEYLFGTDLPGVNHCLLMSFEPTPKHQLAAIFSYRIAYCSTLLRRKFSTTATNERAIVFVIQQKIANYFSCKVRFI